ncbi:acetoin utilization protein AcuC [Pseudalkalibacillus salsuginis]|uniref:acetoin utilization protein AcuC n=1 Tax=Pseudalkalibacillus salsuginis TaxID=2910972 RepID=UPI001F1B2E64|nr:acetoin utilization protein AcuC [Pseudalkalibacillus salsuginis]MCF6408797.1 acetoin utilization protein AcuC [Pseudalkalibacillus salsuginis]
MTKPIFVFSDQLLSYKFSNHHPFNPLRFQMAYELLKETGILSDDQIVKPRKATDEEILLVHNKDYLNAIKKAGLGQLPESLRSSFGLDTDDTPIFKDMHEASSWLVGATLTATEQVFEGKTKKALSLGGGLHHGFRGRASGFCIYNDSSIAIEYMKQKYNARVLYIDTDAHHGDGVQWAFYDDPDVCTFSIHETGRYLFPGTGNVSEKGAGKGYGYSFNLPVDAFTEDDSWIPILEEAIDEIVKFFKPDIIISQNGVDAHYWDPLTHLSLTMKSYRKIPELVNRAADRYTEGRWIAVGGGGYDIWRVVPRAWSMIWAEMNGIELQGTLPEAWLTKWQEKAPVDLPSSWDDGADLYPSIPRKQEICDKNHVMLQRTLQHIRNEKKSV